MKTVSSDEMDSSKALAIRPLSATMKDPHRSTADITDKHVPLQLSQHPNPHVRPPSPIRTPSRPQSPFYSSRDSDRSISKSGSAERKEIFELSVSVRPLRPALLSQNAASSAESAPFETSRVPEHSTMVQVDVKMSNGKLPGELQRGLMPLMPGVFGAALSSDDFSNRNIQRQKAIERRLQFAVHG